MTNNALSMPRYNFQAFPFHLVESSPWPILTANAVLSMMIGAVLYFNGIAHGTTLVSLGFLATLFAFILWFRDVTTEGTYLGDHTLIVQKGLTMGVSLFIVTEVFFFISIFWAYFHSSLAPTVELGSQWPPVGVTALNPMTVPLLNTVLLLSSGATVTYAHHALIEGNRKAAIGGVALTIFLARMFTALQGLEYKDADFTIADGVYGSCFFFSTGFHGFHVLIGTLFITVAFFRIIAYHFTVEHHLGLESSILYWHFVDVVWLFLYGAVYWWGSDGILGPEIAVGLLGKYVFIDDEGHTNIKIGDKNPYQIPVNNATLAAYSGSIMLFIRRGRFMARATKAGLPKPVANLVFLYAAIPSTVIVAVYTGQTMLNAKQIKLAELGVQKIALKVEKLHTEESVLNFVNNIRDHASKNPGFSDFLKKLSPKDVASLYSEMQKMGTNVDSETGPRLVDSISSMDSEEVRVERASDSLTHTPNRPSVDPARPDRTQIPMENPDQRSIIPDLEGLLRHILNFFSGHDQLRRIPRGNNNFSLFETVLHHNLTIHSLCLCTFLRILILTALYITTTIDIVKNPINNKEIESYHPEPKDIVKSVPSHPISDIITNFFVSYRSRLIYYNFVVLLLLLTYVLVSLLLLDINYLPEDIAVNYELGKQGLINKTLGFNDLNNIINSKK